MRKREGEERRRGREKERRRSRTQEANFIIPFIFAAHKPQINPRSKSIKLTTPVHERLYKVGMDSIVDKHKFMVLPSPLSALFSFFPLVLSPSIFECLLIYMQADNWDFSFTTRKPLTLGLDVEPNAMV